MSKVTINGVEHRPVEDCGHCWAEAHGEPDPRPHDRWVVTVCDECDELWPCQHAKRVACGDSWEGHECRLPEGHEGDHSHEFRESDGYGAACVASD